MKGAKHGSKSRLALELGVSRATLYYRRKIPEKDEELRRRIELVMREHPGYGTRRVAIALGMSRKPVRRVMRKYGLKPSRRAKAPMKPLDHGNEPAHYPDILSVLYPIVPDFVWASDFTFISYRGEFIYLCTVLDMFTGEALGFNISRTHDAEFVRRAIERAFARSGIFPQWFHSDQGSEYVAATVCAWLESQGVSVSMSPKASPWHNASQESFFGRFKVEFGDPDRFETLAELLEALYEHLHYFCCVRIKTRLKMSPTEFRMRWSERQEELRKIEPRICPKTSDHAQALPSGTTHFAVSTALPGNSQVMSLPPINPPPAPSGRG